MDKIISKIVGLGVPGLILLVVISTSGLAGGAAIVAALAFLGGPLGMLGGIGLLGLLVLISKGLSEYGFEAIFKGVIMKMKEEGKTKEDIISKIRSYPISKQLKLSLLDYINQYWDTI
jgi:hypothetical protein